MMWMVVAHVVGGLAVLDLPSQFMMPRHLREYRRFTAVKKLAFSYGC
jgi:hypothetical protein